MKDIATADVESSIIGRRATLSAMRIDPGEPIVADRRATVLEVTERLIAVHGYDAVKLRDVAADAGVSIGLLQHYFTTRDALVREAMAVASARRIDTWTRSAEGAAGPWEKVVGLLSGAVNDRQRCAVWLELCAASLHHPELRDDVDDVQRAWRVAIHGAIDAGVRAGVFAPQVPEAALTDTLVNLIDGKLLEIATSAEERGTDEWLETTITLTRSLLGIHAETG